MHAVLSVDLELRLAVVALDHFVDARRAIALRRFGVLGQVDLDRDRGVLELQVDGLVFLVLRRGERNARELVESQLAVGLGILDRLVARRLLRRGVVRLAVLHRVAEADAADDRIGPHVEAAEHDAQVRAELRPQRLDVAHDLEVPADLAVAHFLFIALEFIAATPLADRLGDGVGGGDAGEHRIVAPLDARHIDHAGGTAEQRAPREDEFGQRLEATLGDRARAVGDPLAALEGWRDRGVGLEALELVVGRQVRVLVVEVDHEADGNEVVAVVVEERPATRRTIEGPAEAVLHQPRLVLLRRDLPEFLKADPELLRLGILVQLEAANELLRERTARAFREKHVLAVQLHARREAVLGLAVAANAHVAGRNAIDRAVGVVENLGGGKARIDLDAQFLGLLAEPAHDVAETDDIVAVIAHERRHHEVRQREFAGWTQHEEPVARHLRRHRRALLAPVRDERVEADGIDHRARQDMRADLGTLLEDDDTQVLARLGGDLLQADRGRQPGGPGTDDHDIELHRLALDGSVGRGVTICRHGVNFPQRFQSLGHIRWNAPARSRERAHSRRVTRSDHVSDTPPGATAVFRPAGGAARFAP